MKSKELRSAGFIVAGGALLGLTVRLFMSGDLIPGVLALSATVALIVFGRRKAKEEQGEEALKAAQEYDRLHGDDSGEDPTSKDAP